MPDLKLARDRHLFAPGRKRILALDGGGVRGAVTIAFLEKLEARVAEKEGKPVRLCDWFDLIGGTSTGAILGAGLALGLSSADLKEFYFRLAPSVFKTSWWHLPGWSTKFDARRLREELETVFGDLRLNCGELLTGFAAILKRVDTGGSWIVINNPKSKFWSTPEDRSYIGNAELSLAKLVRASTAAPHYFSPELIDIVEGDLPGLFLDGAMTPHNNPALALFLAVTLPPVGIQWASGPDELSIVSIGTGSFRPTLSIREAKRSHAIGLALMALGAQIAENQRLTLTLMSWLGQTSVPWRIDSEIGDVGEITPSFGPLFRFARFDVSLEAKWLSEQLDVTVGPQDLARLRKMDTPSNMRALYELGSKAAEMQITTKSIGF